MAEEPFKGEMAETLDMFNNKKRNLKEDTVLPGMLGGRRKVFYDAPEGRAWMEAELPRVLKGFSGGDNSEDCDVVSGYLSGLWGGGYGTRGRESC